MRKMGKLMHGKTQTKLTNVKSYIDQGLTVTSACKKAGVSLMTWYRYNKVENPRKKEAKKTRSAKKDQCEKVSLEIALPGRPTIKLTGNFSQIHRYAAEFLRG